MATLTVRHLDERTKTNLRIRAARHDRSMEAEARAILTQALNSETPSRSTWFAQARAAVVERGTYAGYEFEGLRDDDHPRAAIFDETDR